MRAGLKENLMATFQRGLLIPHGAAVLYTLGNLGVYLENFLAVGMDNMPFFAGYLTLLFACIASVAYIFAVWRHKFPGLAMLATCQVIIAGLAVSRLGEQHIGTAVMLLYGPSIIALRQLLRQRMLQTAQRKAELAAMAKE